VVLVEAALIERSVAPVDQMDLQENRQKPVLT